MANPLAHVITHRTGGIVGAPRRGTELGLERVLQSRYRIVEPIGTGGSSQVYLAQDTALNREVAIKVLDPAAAADGKTRGMFVKEARALAQLSHPNIVAVYDVGEVDGAPFIVMEHLPGGSLKQRIERGGALRAGDAVRIATEVANGLQFAHGKGIIHADLKPSNILFDANDTAKICDFGIARTPQEDADTPQLFATAMYVAPERVEGKGASIASDVYGLGLVLYEMLVSKPPFTSTNASVLLRDHVVRQPVPPSHLRPSLPKELDTVALKALAKQPNLRYQKAHDFANALAHIENVDKELATTRLAVVSEPIQDFLPQVEQSPVVYLLSQFGQPIRHAFFGVLAALPVFGLALLAGFGPIAAGLAAGLVAIVGFGGQLALALAIAWIIESLLLFIFVPVLAVLFALLGVILWARDVAPERTALAMAMPATAPFGLAPAVILTSAAVHGLSGVLTVAWGAVVTMIYAIALGEQSIGPFASTGLSLRQESLFSRARAEDTKAALLNMLQNPGDRFGPLGTQLDPSTLTNQVYGLVSRISAADVTAIATVLAWTIAALTVWTLTRILRTFFDTLLRRPKRWFTLYVFATAVGVGSGATILYMLAETWSPLALAPGRPAGGLLFVSALVGALIALAAGVVISATEKPELAEERAPSMAARRVPVR